MIIELSNKFCQNGVNPDNDNPEVIFEARNDINELLDSLKFAHFHELLKAYVHVRDTHWVIPNQWKKRTIEMIDEYKS